LTCEHFERELLDSGEIVRLFDMQTATPPHAYYVVYEKQAAERPEVAAFLKWAQASFRVT
jgi:LysR family glycine cleavage system transcriptional activator